MRKRFLGFIYYRLRHSPRLEPMKQPPPLPGTVTRPSSDSSSLKIFAAANRLPKVLPMSLVPKLGRCFSPGALDLKSLSFQSFSDLRSKSTTSVSPYCAVYLGAFLTASGLKFLINVLQTVIGQNSLADMRRQLHDHTLKLPQAFFRTTQSGR